ncbi:DedA family protein [Oceaniglobus trochenteri]|uniref:DedA family protein n=1 Tax=Oceaniglobus trochenteri TaxID=2763260 RepID=UPI001CFF8E1D|nr:VTT domain-containing protein [Oceaniglobus trochenteri]
MTDALADLVIHHGVLLVLAATFLSCLAVPVPTSLIMLSAGAFSAGDDLSLTLCALAALAGALAGDQAGFALGRWSSGIVTRARGRAARLLEQARALTARRGGMAVYLSRWLFSPLGPYVNYIAGATGMAWVRFTFWAVLGEGVWVAIYLGAGYIFADQIEAVATILSNASGAAAGLVVTAGLGLWLWRQSVPRQDG